MMESITSQQNRWVKLAASLKQKKYRDETGLFTIEGVRLVEEAIASGWGIEACFFTEESVSKQRIRQMIDDLALQEVKLLQITNEIFDKIAETEQPQGILSLVRKKQYTLSDALGGKKVPLIVILESIQDPGNVGTLIRTADAAGCSGVILTKGCADVFAGKTARASMGSLFHLPITAGVESSEILSALRQSGIALLATSLATRNLYYEVDMNRPVAIVFGNEGSGVRAEILEAANDLMYIPIFGKAESLNVAASAAVILFDAMRQRQVGL
jgi:TrmH family RNA methyltransferase